MFRLQTFVLSFAVYRSGHRLSPKMFHRGRRRLEQTRIKSPQTTTQQYWLILLRQSARIVLKRLRRLLQLESKMPAVMEAANHILSLEQDKSSKPYRIAKRLVLKRVEITKVAQRARWIRSEHFCKRLFH